MKYYEITTTAGKTIFNGTHLPERERPNWHYYETEEGSILHFRKEHMILVKETELTGKREPIKCGNKKMCFFFNGP